MVSTAAAGTAAGCWLRAPSDGDRCGDQRRIRGQGDGVVPAREHNQGRGEEIGRERGRRNGVDPPWRRLRPKQEIGDDQHRRENKAGDHVKIMRGEPIEPVIAEPGEGPQDPKNDGRDREPAPQPRPRQSKGCRSGHAKIEVERPVIRLARDDDQRREIRADEA
jgi:hypothetical protein